MVRGWGLHQPMSLQSGPDHPFLPGEVLERRFRIVREIARGGMGVVYEAWDERLGRRIALKCAKLNYRRVLPREVRTATEVSHPNVCKLYEIHTAVTRHGETDFLTMEYLEGETLSARLARGPLTEETARRIARQLCAGLGEAHRIGVLHGDLKPNNVILVGRGADVRAVLTDFGLAHRMDAVAGSDFAGGWGGTPGYMAPELEKGAAASVASDIYALGVMFAELAPACRPGAAAEPVHPDAETATVTTLPKTAFSPESQRTGPVRVHPKWDAVIARCLQAAPEKRFPDVPAVERALAPSRTWRRLGLAAGIAALAAATGLLTYTQATAPQKNIRLAITGQAGRPGNEALAVLRGSASTRFSLTDRENATHLLSAAVSQNGSGAKPYELRVRITEARSGIEVRAWTMRYAPDELRFVPGAIAGVVTGTFELPAPVQPALPTHAKEELDTAMQLVARPSAADEALALLVDARKAAPDSPLVYAAMAEAQWSKYFQTRDQAWLDQAKESVVAAELRQPDLAPVLRMAGLLMADSGGYEQAAAAYRRAIQLDPSNGDAWRRMGISLLANNQIAEARAAYQRALEVSPADFRNFQQLGAFEDAQGNFSEAVRRFVQAVRLAPKEAAPHRALGNEYLAMGRPAEAEKELRLSLELAESAFTLHSLAVALMSEREDRQAIRYLKRALEIGTPRPLWLMSLSIASRRAGEARASATAVQQGMELAERELRKNPRDPENRALLAYLLARHGDAGRALSEISQALQPRPVGAQVQYLAICTYQALGRREDALNVLRGARPEVIAQIQNWPDLEDLARDPTGR
jgi:tetratricopeptide (TPR) repeat protein/predicted Ser/Thr protein kinase